MGQLSQQQRPLRFIEPIGVAKSQAQVVDCLSVGTGGYGGIGCLGSPFDQNVGILGHGGVMNDPRHI